MKFFDIRNKNNIFVISIALVIGSVFFWYATATEPTNIEAEHKFAWGENVGWLNFGSDDGGVMVEDLALSGYVWSENLGWISLNCSNDNSCATSDYKVANDGEGNLSGYAWGENIGWVNFSPTNGGVHIDSSGEFSGYAWAENTGWIIFNCQDLDSCDESDFQVRTTWLPFSARNQDESEEEEEQEGIEVSDVHYSSTDTMIVISWETNHNADSHVRYGKDKNLEKEKNDNDNEKKHRVVLRNLEPDTQYYFHIKSTNENNNSDTSKIYSIFTKPTPVVFARRQWEKIDNTEKPEESYEKVEIDVTDKREIQIVNEEKPEEKVVEIKTQENRVDKPSIVSRLFLGTKNMMVGFFSGAYDLALGGQRKIVEFFDFAGERIADVYNSFVAKFNEEKATEIARLKKVKYFTTKVFNRDEKKLLAEVRFQILDKTDNPIPALETTLFSDPQTTVTDGDGIATFKDIPIGSHTLAFDYEGENFRKNVVIADTLTDEGNVRAEIVQVKAEREKIAVWMWGVIVLLIIAILVAAYFARQYYRLRKDIDKLQS